MKVYVTTDTHFNHPNICDFENRPKDFKERICKNWEATVGKEDLTIHLGDVIFYNRNELKPMLDALPGRKVVVKGNHDHNQTFTWFMRNGFDFAAQYFVFKNIVFSHVPMPKMQYYYKSSKDDRPKLVDCMWNIHGHFHSKSHSYKAYNYYDHSYHIHFQIEDTLAPMNLDKIVGAHQRRLKNGIPQVQTTTQNWRDQIIQAARWLGRPWRSG